MTADCYPFVEQPTFLTGLGAEGGEGRGREGKMKGRGGEGRGGEGKMMGRRRGGEGREVEGGENNCK